MKKSKITLLAILSLGMMVGCNRNTSSNLSNSTSSSTSQSQTTNSNTTVSTNSEDNSTSSSSTTSVTPVEKKATIKKIKNYVEGSTLNVKEGDEISLSGTITLTFKNAVSNSNYQIYFNGVIANMTMASDNLSSSYSYTAKENENVTIAVIEKNKENEAEEGKTLTFTQGDHYSIIGIESGHKYFADVETSQNIYFAIITEDGYFINNVKIAEDEDSSSVSSLSKDDDGFYKINTLYSNSTITVETEKATSHTITYIKDCATAENHIDTTKSVLPTSFIGGETVNFSFIATSGYAVTDVTFNFDYNLGNTDYSNYSIELPNKDVEINITTGSIVKLRFASSITHLKNVEFYSNVNYGSGDEDYTIVSVSNPISETPVRYGKYIYVSFNTDDGYKPGDAIKGATDEDGASGYKVGTTKDGKYVYAINITKDTDLYIDLYTKKTVSLDSSATDVNILFDGDIKSYYFDDKVEFDLMLNASVKNKRIGKVYYSYTDADGVTHKEEIYADSYSTHAYSFYMPNYDVTIIVEVNEFEKKTLSYTNTTSEGMVSSIEIKGATSNAQLDIEKTSSTDFEKNESVAVSIVAGDKHTKTIKATFVDKNNNETAIKLTLDADSKTYEGKFSLSDEGTIKIEDGDDATARTISVPTDADFEYYTSEETTSKVTTLPSLYDMDIFYFVVNNKPSVGKILNVNVSRNNNFYNCEQIKIGNKTAYRVIVNGDVEIKLEETDGVKLTITDPTENYEGDGSDIVYDFDLDDNIKISNGYIAKGSKFYVSADDYGLQVDNVKIDGVETKGSYEYDGFNLGFVATGNVEITLKEYE